MPPLPFSTQQGVTSLDDLQRLLGRLRRDVCEAWAAAQREGFAPGAASRAALDTSLGRLAQVRGGGGVAGLRGCMQGLKTLALSSVPPAVPKPSAALPPSRTCMYRLTYPATTHPPSAPAQCRSSGTRPSSSPASSICT